MKIKAPEGYTATMKRVDSFEVGRAHFEVSVKKDGQGNGGFKVAGLVRVPVGTYYASIIAEAREKVLAYVESNP